MYFIRKLAHLRTDPLHRSMNKTTPVNHFLSFNTVWARDVSTQLTGNEAVLNTGISSSRRLSTPRPKVASGMPFAWNIKGMGLLNVDFFHLVLYEFTIYPGLKDESKLFLFFPNCESRYDKVEDYVCPVACNSVNFRFEIRFHHHLRSRSWQTKSWIGCLFSLCSFCGYAASFY